MLTPITKRRWGLYVTLLSVSDFLDFLVAEILPIWLVWIQYSFLSGPVSIGGPPWPEKKSHSPSHFTLLSFPELERNLTNPILFTCTMEDELTCMTAYVRTTPHTAFY